MGKGCNVEKKWSIYNYETGIKFAKMKQIKIPDKSFFKFHVSFLNISLVYDVY